MYLILQQEEPDDYVIATGEQHSVREFIVRAFAEVGVGLRFEGSGTDEVGVVDTIDESILERARDSYGPPEASQILTTGATVVKIDPRYYRPTEVASLLGDPTKARRQLGWQTTIGFPQLVQEMVAADLEEARRDELVLQRGFSVKSHRE